MTDFRLCERDDVKYTICEPLAHPGFVHAFSTRQGGISPLPKKALNLGYGDSDEAENVAENRRRFLRAIGAPEMKLVTVKQVHSAEMVVIRESQDIDAEVPSVCDALITNVPGCLLGVQTADCVPILVADVQQRVVAAIHAGWRGTRARLVEKTVERMQMEFGTRSADCVAAIGPSVGVCCYEVGDDVIDQFRSEFDYAESAISNHKPNRRAHLDLIACNRQQLLKAGLVESNVFASEFCTMCRNDLFFSYRLERANGVGRMLSVIGVAS